VLTNCPLSLKIQIKDKVFWPCEDSHNDNDNESKDGGSVFGRLLGRKGRRKRDVGVNVWYVGLILTNNVMGSCFE
jgi:hypothetical protein